MSTHTRLAHIQGIIRSVNERTVLASLLKLVFVMLDECHLRPHAAIHISAKFSVLVAVTRSYRLKLLSVSCVDPVCAQIEKY